jgi:glucose/arabinose dehydrogenase/PKD repeat protein
MSSPSRRGTGRPRPPTYAVWLSLGLALVTACGGHARRPTAPNATADGGSHRSEEDAATAAPPSGDQPGNEVDAARTEPEDPSAPLPRGFSERVVWNDLVRPTSLRFAKDGRVFVSEKSGIIKAYASTSAATPVVVADLGPEVHDYGDRGLLDIELDPGFPERPYLYALYTLDGRLGDSLADGSVPRYHDACPDPKIAGCVVAGRLVRLELSADMNKATTNRSQTILVENWPQQFPSHSIGSLAFGPDGLLYVSSGDGASFEQVDYGNLGGNPLHEPPDTGASGQRPPKAMGGALRAQVVQPPSGFDTWFSGKIIRFDPNGTQLPLGRRDLPTPGPIVANGLRNPFRFTFRPGAPELFIADVGWSTWEEIDRIADVTATGTPGIPNFGWPCFEGNEVQPGYQAAGLDVCAALYSRPASHTPPLFQYRRTSEVVMGDDCGTGSSAISGIALYDNGPFPKDYAGALFFSDFGRKCIWVMPAGDNGAPDPTRTRRFMHKAAQPVQLRLGPEGDLYYIDFGGIDAAGSVRRIVYQGGNHQPHAAVTATPALGPVPLKVTFDASGSADPDSGTQLKYAWDLDGDGDFDDGEGARLVHTFDHPATLLVRVRVSDGSGASATAAVKVWPGHVRPTAVIDAVTPERFGVNDTIAFSGHGFDSEGTALPPEALSWSVVLHHCPDNCHEHALQQFAGMAAGSFRAPDHEYPVHLSLVLTVTGTDGLSETVSRTLEPETTPLRLDSQPAGLELVVNGIAATTPATRTVIRGSTNSLSAPSQVMGETAYRFVSWSDRRAQSHSVTAAGDDLYTATFETLPLTSIGRQATHVIIHTTPGGGTLSTDERDRIRDGKHPETTSTDEYAQLSTKTVPPGDDDRVFVGYEFSRAHTFARLVFQEGLNQPDGGHFDTLGVEVRAGGRWNEVTGLRVMPTYAGANGKPWETFVLDFEPTAGEAIRLVGRPGGTARYDTVAELEACAAR